MTTSQRGTENRRTRGVEHQEDFGGLKGRLPNLSPNVHQLFVD